MRSDQNQDQSEQSMWNAEYDPFVGSSPAGEPLFPTGPHAEPENASGTMPPASAWNQVSAEDYLTDAAAMDAAPAEEPSWTPASSETLPKTLSETASETAPHPQAPKPEKGRSARVPGGAAQDKLAPSVPTLPPVDYTAGYAQGGKAGVAQGVRPVSSMRRSGVGGQFGETYEARFAIVTDLMEHGAWPQALEKLRMLQKEYPQATNLAALVDEAVLKTELMETWAHTIKGRRLTVGQEWLLRRSLPFALVLILFVGVALFYQTYVAPSRQVLALEQANQAQIEEALGLIQMGKFTSAMGLLEEVLARDPANIDAQQGLASARTQLGLTVNYDVALDVATAGNLPRAIAILESIKAKSPSFRDVEDQINRLTAQAEARAMLAAADRSFSQRRYLEAIQRYEQASMLNSEQEAKMAQERLNEAYFKAGLALTQAWPRKNAGPEEARALLRKAQLAGDDRARAHAAVVQLDTYLDGLDAAQNDELAAAINYWRELYDSDSHYLGGYLAELLYWAYLDLGAEAAGEGRIDYARELYELAAGLAVSDTSEAMRRLGYLAATATPTP